MPGNDSMLAAVHARDEAIRQARRIGDPAAVCAALAVTRAWEADEARGRDLAGQFLQGGLLTGEQIRALVGIEGVSSVDWASEPTTAAGEAQQAIQPEPAAVAVLETPEPAQPAPAPPPIDIAPPVAASPTATEIGAAEAPPAAPETTPVRPSRWPMAAAAVLGVVVAIGSWLPLGGDRPPSFAPATVPSAPTPAPRLKPFPSAPLPPQAAPRPPQPAPRPPIWAPRLREVREGDSSAVHDRLSRLGSQALIDDESAGVSFDARQLVSRRPRKDRIVRWVELKLGRFHAVAGLQSRFEDDAPAVDVAWARE
mgnify:CR=1 FL=1